MRIVRRMSCVYVCVFGWVGEFDDYEFWVFWGFMIYIGDVLIV